MEIPGRQAERPDMNTELAEWFTVDGDVDDFIYYWDTNEESGR